jgi:hypothetical protein
LTPSESRRKEQSGSQNHCGAHLLCFHALGAYRLPAKRDKKNIPQGLKPADFARVCGTTKLVPCYRAFAS